jgi:inorganic pyrophosphatase
MTNFDWAAWENLLREQTIVLDRPRGTSHPSYADMIYPVDYGYVVDTVGDDGEEFDVFFGTSDTGLTAVLLTCDAMKNEQEIKLMWNLSEEEVNEVTQFVNRGAMTGTVVWRQS